MSAALCKLGSDTAPFGLSDITNLTFGISVPLRRPQVSVALCKKPAAQRANLDKVQAEQQQEAARTREEVRPRAERAPE